MDSTRKSYRDLHVIRPTRPIGLSQRRLWPLSSCFVASRVLRHNKNFVKVVHSTQRIGNSLCVAYSMGNITKRRRKALPHDYSNSPAFIRLDEPCPISPAASLSQCGE